MILVHWLVSDLLTGHVLGDIVSGRHDLSAACGAAAVRFGREAADLTVVEKDMLSPEAVRLAATPPVTRPRRKRR